MTEKEEGMPDKGDAEGSILIDRFSLKEAG
jgi:hypothetical protein